MLVPETLHLYQQIVQMILYLHIIILAISLMMNALEEVEMLSKRKMNVMDIVIMVGIY
jgi:hypothetical protein